MARVGVFVIQKPLLYLSERRSCVRRAADRLDALEPISDADATAGLRTAPTRVQNLLTRTMEEDRGQN